MKILKITSEGYKPVGDYISHGDHYFLVWNGELDTVIEKFNNWRNGLGKCLDALSIDNHDASSHVYCDIFEAEDIENLISKIESK